MIIPYSTDAPLYHWPVVTAGLIATNVVVFIALVIQFFSSGMDFEQFEWLVLMPDQINPLQWLTSLFMHANPFHLLSNMFFLFVFGVIVEGKIGSVKFASIYFAIGVGVAAITQVGMFVLGSELPAMGASAAIAGLMLIAILWAPDNDVHWFFFVWRLETPVAVFALYFIMADILAVLLSGFTMSGALSHVIGTVLGFFVGGYCLRHDIVDCEGWDAVSRNDWLKKYPMLYGEKQRQRDALRVQDDFDPVTSALQMEGGDVDNAARYGATRLPDFCKSNLQERKQRQEKRKQEGGRQKRRFKRVHKTEGEELTEKCQSHPEFNRLAFVLRDSVKSGNLVEAMRTFRTMDQLKISPGLAEVTLMGFAKALGQAKQWIDAIRPLVVLIEKRGPQADEGRLLMAQIQTKVMKRKDLAIKTLEEIQTPVLEEGAELDPTTASRLKRRDELLERLRQVV
ncbi:rhomboid family intramembrane serine protease [Stieleria sp. JC731]|uniref:rhomboid family intramembrane serine protease n=1 Tax=Pirellulaceae TaxID=2691357 RepID=UPI001E62C8C0|nr:rhomboid family intramembrane serine protease [Stieleria sp. JC731]MCC9602015.1 rhomboid family intramembrane serine protease [Stieleria sp. JC731]